MMVGSTVSKVIVSVAAGVETFPAASRNWAQTVFSPSPAFNVCAIVMSNAVVDVTFTKLAAEQSEPFATR